MKDILEFKRSREQGAGASDLLAPFKKNIEDQNSDINAMVWINPKSVEQSEQACDGPLQGVPIAIKDLLCHKGVPTTASSNYLKEFVPSYSSTVTQRLVDAGAVIIGKANLDEFAMGSSNENSCFGTVRNPYNKDYVAGGSSGGSAAAVAAGMCVAAIGSDTGGSIRQPASFCGLVGIKPTYGRVSRFGMVAFASSLDQAGPMTNGVLDSAKILEVISGFDRQDSTTVEKDVPNWQSQINSQIKGRKVGVIKEFAGEGISSSVSQAFAESIEQLKRLGAEIVEVSVPSIVHSVSVYYLIATSEASSNLSRFDGIRYGHRYKREDGKTDDLDTMYKKSRGAGFGSEVKRRILLGTYALSSGYYDAYYLKACQVRRLIHDEMKSAFAECDVLMSPVATSPAFKIGERINDPVTMYLNDIFTTSANLAGLPAIAVPTGFSKDKLPVGIQLMANHFDEQSLFDFAKAIEDQGDWKERVYDGI